VGGRLDAVINIDGFNEINTVRNLKKEVLISYPRRWATISAGAKSIDTMKTIGSITLLRSIRSRFSKASTALRWSVTACVGWSFLDAGFEAAITERQWQLANFAERESKHIHRARSSSQDSNAGSKSIATDIWVQSSIDLDSLTRGLGIEHFHLLQPNQYVPGSKAWFAESERMDPPPPHHREGCGLLMQAGKSELLEKGVPYYDLTGLFREVEEVTYLDQCCHLNDLGNRLLVEEVSRIVIQRFESHSRDPDPALEKRPSGGP
jgi:hypothetical protein